MADKKPKGWGRFDDLMKKLVTVPKEQVDQRIAAEQAKRKARRPSRRRALNRTGGTPSQNSCMSMQ